MKREVTVFVVTAVLLIAALCFVPYVAVTDVEVSVALIKGKPGVIVYRVKKGMVWQPWRLIDNPQPYESLEMERD